MKKHGHIIVGGLKYLVYTNNKATIRRLKIRLVGKDGEYLEQDSKYLETDGDTLTKLLSGETIAI